MPSLIKEISEKKQTVKVRYFVSLLSNGISSGIFFLIGMILARKLSPEGYGEYQYMMGLFTSIFAFVDVGSRNAFYTFISQTGRSLKFYLSFLIWQLLQIAAVFGIIIFFSESTLKVIFVESDKMKLLLASAAVFMSSNLKIVICNIAESQRQTVFIQLFSLVFNMIHLCSILVFIYLDVLSIEWVFGIMAIEYLIYFFLGSIRYFILTSITVKDDPLTLKDYMNKYISYCRPLLIYSILSSFILYIDRWMLQRFGGRSQQAFFSVARQFSKISALATTSIMMIYMKEIAEAIRNKNMVRAKNIYLTVSKNLFLFSASISVFLLPYSREILILCYGNAYISGVIPFSIMLFYPVHQTLGQCFGTLFYATEKTRVYTRAGLCVMIAGLFVSYFLLAPREILGFDLGAVGLAWKNVLLQLISVNVLGYIISKDFNWENLFFYQVKVLLALFVFEAIIYYGFSAFSDNIFVTLIANAVIYFSVIASVIYRNYVKYMRNYSKAYAWSPPEETDEPG